MFNWFPGARRGSAWRPLNSRPAVERLEERGAPSGLAVTSQLPLTTDLVPGPLAAGPTDGAAAPGAAAPAPLATGPADGAAPGLPTNGNSFLALLTQRPQSPSAPADGPMNLMAADDGRVGPALAAAVKPRGDDSLALPEPTVNTPIEGQCWHYSCTGTITYPDPTTLTIKITVDGTEEPPAIPDRAGNFSVNFVLPPCLSSTNCRRFGTAVARRGMQTSPEVDFSFTQTPHPPADS